MLVINIITWHVCIMYKWLRTFFHCVRFQWSRVPTPRHIKYNDGQVWGTSQTSVYLWRSASGSDLAFLLLTLTLVTGSTGHTSALRGHQTLTGITYTITPVAALTARPPPVGICGAPEDWNICSKYWLQCCRTCNFHSEEIPQLRGITDSCLTYFITRWYNHSVSTLEHWIHWAINLF